MGVSKEEIIEELKRAYGFKVEPNGTLQLNHKYKAFTNVFDLELNHVEWKEVEYKENLIITFYQNSEGLSIEGHDRGMGSPTLLSIDDIKWHLKHNFNLEEKIAVRYEQLCLF